MRANRCVRVRSRRLLVGRTRAMHRWRWRCSTAVGSHAGGHGTPRSNRTATSKRSSSIGAIAARSESACSRGFARRAGAHPLIGEHAIYVQSRPEPKRTWDPKGASHGFPHRCESVLLFDPSEARELTSHRPEGAGPRWGISRALSGRGCVSVHKVRPPAWTLATRFFALVNEPV